MPIYRGDGGSAETSNNATANEVAQNAADAAASAAAAAASATAAAESETAAETAETNAETAETSAASSATAAAASASAAAASETATINFNTNLVVNASGLAEGASPTVSYDDTTYTMSFGIPVGATGATGATGPQGPTGTAATIAVGTVSTGAAGSSATVTNSGTSSAAVFDFSIPKGDTGDTGATGATGPQGPAGADGADGADGIQLTALSVTTNAAGTAALSYNNTNGVFSYTPPDLSGYLTSYTETDTLDSVTGRGATTTNAVTVGNLTSTGIDDNATSTAITIDSSQNVGIGVSPSVILETNVASGNNEFRQDVAGTARGQLISSATDQYLVNLGSGSQLFYNGGSERMRIDSNGTVQFQNAIEEQQYSLTGTAIDPSNGTIQYKTLSANTTFTESLSDGEFVTLMIDDGSAYTVTWPTITWVGGSAPTLGTTGYNVIHLWQINSVLYGAFIGTTA